MKASSLIILFGCVAAITANVIPNEKTDKYVQTKEGETNSFALLHSSQGAGQFVVNIKDIDKTETTCTESSEFKLNDVNWKIKLCKNVYTSGEPNKNGSGNPQSDSVKEIDPPSFAAYLVSVFGDNNSRSIDATATLTLYGVKNGTENVEKKIEGTFKSGVTEKGIDLVKWDTLKSDHSKDDLATLDITIVTKAPKRVSAFDLTSVKFHVPVHGVNKLGEKFSSEIEVGGIRWSLLVSKQNNYLAVFLYANENDISINTSVDVTATFKLLSAKKDGSSSSPKNKLQHSYYFRELNWGYRAFLPWSEFATDNFVVGNTALFEIDLKVGQPKELN